MVTSNNLSIVISLLLIISCNGKDHDRSRDLFHLTNNSESKEYSINDLISEIEYIPLIEKEGLLISNIKKLYVSSDLFIILNFYSSSIKFYNNEGEFLWNTPGMKEGEYGFGSVTNIFLSPDNNILLLSDITKNKILSYDIHQRKFISEIKIQEFSPYAIGQQNKNIVAITNDRVDGFVKILNEDSIIWSGVKKPDFFNTVITNYSINSDNNFLYVNAGFTDTIYQVKDEKLRPYAVLGQGNSSLNSINLSEFVMDYTDGNYSKYSKELLIPFGNLFIYDNLWFIELVWRDRILIWDKETNNNMVVSEDEIKYWEIIFYPVVFKILATDDEGFGYSYILPTDEFISMANQYISEHENDHIAENLKSVLTKINLRFFENPIIVKFKLNTEFINAL